jgi:hypothetical protein
VKKDWVAVIRNREMPSLHTLTVKGGIGTGKYPAGAAVNLGVGVSPEGQEFESWDAGQLKIQDANAARTTIVMPNADATVSSRFKPAPPQENKADVKKK